jgi:hypothetical protein
LTATVAAATPAPCKSVLTYATHLALAPESQIIHFNGVHHHRGAEMSNAELYLGCDLYRLLVERLMPISGTGNPEPIKAVLGPLANQRLNMLADRLARLEPCSVTGRITENEVKIALGENGNIWPRSIYGYVIFDVLDRCSIN